MTEQRATPAARITYDAFISYRSTSASLARRIRKSLLNLARRHGRSGEFRVFLDTSSLLVGSLGTEIESALATSRHLVVLLATDTAESTWVEREIEYWLTHDGDRDRLFLVRVDAALDLGWDDHAGGFRHPEHIPRPLRDLFDNEQKWIDLSGPESEVTDASLAPLYAALEDIDTSALLLDEAEYQRRRRRLVAGAVGIMAVLLVLSIIGGVVALVSRNEASRQRDQARAAATRAEAEADAAAALLAAPSSFAESIRLILQAAEHVDTPSVRSAMLSVAADTGHLVAALPSRAGGVDLTEAAFDQTGRLLATYGEASDDTTRAVLRDLDNRRTLLDAELELPRVSEVAVVGARRLVACTDDGVALVEVANATAEVSPLVEGDDCALVQLGDGGVVGTASSAGQPSAAYVPTQGRVETAAGVGTVAPGGESALVSGAGGSVVMGPEGVRQVTAQPMLGTGWGDTEATFFVQTRPGRWAFAQRSEDWQLRELPVPPTAVDATPLVGFGTFTGDVAWITETGRVGWTRDDAWVQLRDDETTDWSTSWRTQLVSLADRGVVAVFGHVAFSLQAPGASTAVPDDWVLFDGGWAAREGRGTRLWEPTDDGAAAVYEHCRPDSQVLLRTGFEGEAASLTALTRQAQELPIEAPVAVAPDCQALDGDAALDLVGAPVASTRQQVLPEYAGQQGVLSPTATRAALLARGAPTEVLELDSTTTAGPWGTTRSSDGSALAALGERRVVLEWRTTTDEPDLLILVGPERTEIASDEITESSHLVAVRPDGLGAVTRPAGGGPDQVVADGETAELDPACAGAEVRYLPGPDYAEAVDDAEAQIPAALVDGVWRDCRTAEGAAVTQHEVASYGVGARRGLLVTTDEEGTSRIVMWQHDDQSTASRPLPAGADPGLLALEPDASVAATVDDRRTVRLWSWRDGEWRPETALASSLAGPVSINLVDDSTLVLLMNRIGGFELLDAVTGRRLITEPKREYFEGTITGVQTTVRNGVLYAYQLADGEPWALDVIDVPVGVDVLRGLLCGLYAAPSCPGSP